MAWHKHMPEGSKAVILKLNQLPFFLSQIMALPPTKNTVEAVDLAVAVLSNSHTSIYKLFLYPQDMSKLLSWG